MDGSSRPSHGDPARGVGARGGRGRRSCCSPRPSICEPPTASASVASGRSGPPRVASPRSPDEERLRRAARVTPDRRRGSSPPHATRGGAGATRSARATRGGEREKRVHLGRAGDAMWRRRGSSAVRAAANHRSKRSREHRSTGCRRRTRANRRRSRARRSTDEVARVGGRSADDDRAPPQADTAFPAQPDACSVGPDPRAVDGGEGGRGDRRDPYSKSEVGPCCRWRFDSTAGRSRRHLREGFQRAGAVVADGGGRRHHRVAAGSPRRSDASS